MTEHKIGTIVYAQGWIDDFISGETEPIVIDEGSSDEVQQDAAEQNEYFVQVRNMWTILSEGLDQIRRENVSLQNKLMLVDSAMKTPT